MAQLRGGSTINGVPIMSGVGKQGYLPLFLNNGQIGNSVITQENGTIIIPSNGRTIAGSNLNDAWLKIGDNLGIDDNEIYFQTGGHIGTIGGSLNFRTNNTQRLMIDELGKVQLFTPASGSTSTLELGRLAGVPNIKANANDGYLIMDSNGQATSINHYTTDNVVLANGGGNVAIGNNWTPSEKFEVEGNALIKGAIYLNDTNTTISEGQYNTVKLTTPNGYITVGAENTSYAHITTDRPIFYFNKGLKVDSGIISSHNEDLSLQTAGTTRITAKNDTGNVGIGTTSPSYSLDVFKSTGVTARLQSNEFAQVVLESDIDGTPRLWALQSNSVDGTFRINEDGTVSSTRFTIAEGGNVGIGNATPAEKLDVAGSVKTDSQFKSTIATGTPPLSVTSTTVVSNLNADMLDGKHASDFALSHSHPYDNYGSWSFAVDGVTKDAITSGDVLDFVSGSNVTITRSNDDKITISSTDTNTWRGIVDNLTSTSTTDSLTANQGKTLKDLIDGLETNKMDTHTHPYLPLAGGDVTGATTFASTLAIGGTTVTSGYQAQVTGSLNVTNNILADNYGANQGNGYGLKFWNSDSYKVYMSATTDTTWGGRLDATSDYNMYFKMTGGTNRGFVFRSGDTNVAQIDASGNIYATLLNVDTVDTTTVNATTVNTTDTTASGTSEATSFKTGQMVMEFNSSLNALEIKYVN